MAKANYDNIRRFLGKEFALSRTSAGGRRWTEGVAVRTTFEGVRVDFNESHAEFYSNGRLRTAKLAAVRELLESRPEWTVTERADGSFLVTDAR